MATAESITQALARLRADRPGLGLEDSIDAHWIDWFGGAEFPDAELFAGVNHYIEIHPKRTWPTVGEIEYAIKEIVRIHREHRELEAGPCLWDCVDGLVYKDRTAQDPVVMVPCKCKKGIAQREGLNAWAEARKRARGEGGERP